MEKQTGAHMLVIAMTAHAIAGYRERCLQAGMDGYVTKPVRRQALPATLAKFEGLPEPAAAGGSVRPPR